MDTNEVMIKNESVLEEYFKGIASCNYYNGMSYQLYLDLDDNRFVVYVHPSSTTWQERSDGSLVHFQTIEGYCDLPQDERYSEDCDATLWDFGYQDWLDEIETLLSEYFD